jgi:hypothetical protein
VRAEAREGRPVARAAAGHGRHWGAAPGNPRPRGASVLAREDFA